MFTAIAVTALVCFVAGMAFSKVVLSEATTVKQHVTQEISALRAEIRGKL